MSTVLRVGRYRFHFFSNESNDHRIFTSRRHEAKFWLDPVQLAANYGFNGSELTEIERIIREHRDELLEAWHERFG
jgi:hypothetical protein